jgi:hypothetical protein
LHSSRNTRSVADLPRRIGQVVRVVDRTSLDVVEDLLLGQHHDEAREDEQAALVEEQLERPVERPCGLNQMHRRQLLEMLAHLLDGPSAGLLTRALHVRVEHGAEVLTEGLERRIGQSGQT